MSELEPPGEPPAAPAVSPAASTGPLAPPGLAADIGFTAAANRTAELDACAGLPDGASAEVPGASHAPTIHTSAAPPRSNVTGLGRRDNNHPNTRESTSGTTESTTRTRRSPAEATDTITSTSRDHQADTAAPGASTARKNRRTFDAQEVGHDHAALDAKARRDHASGAQPAPRSDRNTTTVTSRGGHTQVRSTQATGPGIHHKRQTTRRTRSSEYRGTTRTQPSSTISRLSREHDVRPAPRS